jgi:hypothetical protein
MDSSHIHHLQVVAEHLAIGQTFVTDGVRIAFGIIAVNPVHFCRFEEDIGLQFPAPQCSRGVSGNKRIARPATQNDNPSFFRDGGGSVGGCTVRLRFPCEWPRASVFHNPEIRWHPAKPAVEHRSQHPHVVGSGFLDDFATGAELCPAQNVARAHNNGQLHTTVANTLGLPGDGERFFDADARFAGPLKLSPLNFNMTRRYAGAVPRPGHVPGSDMPNSSV